MEPGIEIRRDGTMDTPQEGDVHEFSDSVTSVSV
jgi:hypothetical protein